jgi:ribosomal protein L32
MEFTPEGRAKTTPDTSLLVTEAVKRFRKEFRNRSFSQRNLALGKMVNCAVCGTRHRSSRICQQQFVVELTPPEGLTHLTKFQILGRKAFAGKRVKPHYSKKQLQLVQRTWELMPLEEGLWSGTETKSAEMVAMQVARRNARAQLKRERNEKRSKLQAAQRRSRRVNLGFLAGNSRIGR